MSHLVRKAGHDTYLAHPVDEPEHQVVLKMFDADCLVPEATLSDFRRMETRLQELKHPHIVAVLELGIELGQPYIVSEYQAGGSLRQYLNQRSSGHLPLEEAVGVVMQVGRAVAFVHEQGMVHQDIRPENILLNEEGKVLLADFRLGSLIQEPEQKDSADGHEMNYQAPERMIGSANAASDQYALGCLLYELMTGVLPNPPVLRQHATLTDLVASTTLPKLPRRVEVVLLRTLAIKPRERYPDVTTFLAELKAAVKPEPPAFPFAHLTSGYQQTVSSDPTEEEFPLLLPDVTFMPQKPMVQEKKEAPVSPASNSLEAFLTIPEWDGVSLLDRLAVVEGQEGALLLSGTPIEASSQEPPPPSPEQSETASLAEMALASLLGEHVPAQSVSQKESLIREEDTDQVFLSIPDKRFDASVMDTLPLYTDGEQTTPHAQEQPIAGMPHWRRRSDPTRAQRLLMPAWKRPIVWLVAALVLTLISVLFVYAFNTRSVTAVKNGPLAATSKPSSPANPTAPVVTPPTTVPPTTAPKLTPSAPVILPTLTPSSNAAVVPIGKTIWLQAVINNSYVSARLDHTDVPLEAMSQSVNTWEEFDVVDAGNGYITLRSRANSNYVCAQFKQTNSPLQASSDVLQSCAKFRWIDKGNGKIALQVATGTSYVSARIDLHNALLCARDTNIPSEDLFLWGIVSLVDSK